ncbi:MAG: FHA domain-containing protein [Thermoguttaceae bacterium]
MGGKTSKRSISLKLPTVIGRGGDATLKIAHRMISRRHCEIYDAGGLLMIRDLGSLNGTVVGGQRVKVAPLPPQAEFSIGPLTFQADYQYAGDLDSLPAPVLAETKADAPVAAADASADPPDFEIIETDSSVDGEANDGVTPRELARPAQAASGTSSAATAPKKAEKKPYFGGGARTKNDAPTAKPSSAAKTKPVGETAGEKPEAKPADKPEDPFDAFLNELG